MERQVAISQELKASLEKARTPEEKSQAIGEFRTKMRALQLPRAAQSGSGTALEKTAEIKKGAADSPEAEARYAALETRVKAAEAMRVKMEKLSEATPEQRAAILEEIQSDREALARAFPAEISTPDRTRTPSADQTALPPEMQALRAKSEERRREIAAFKEALDQATPEQRTALLRDWQKKRLADRPVASPSPPATK